jgi:crotonobetainyl-CoA:carnitine CoA-transferase CaiB-like acyl-CoA transferase
MSLLDDIRVVEFAAVLAGPLTGLLLADLGADVIKVEPPGGDMLRRNPPIHNGVSAVFYAANRNKRSVVLDLRTDEGRQAARRLAVSADVVLENWRPGVADRLGLGADDLLELNPRLVIAGMRGFGESGTYAQDRAFDSTIQAVAGMAIFADGQAPMLHPNLLADKVTAVYAALAITAALVKRDRTGHGEVVRVSMLDVALAFQWPDAFRDYIFEDALVEEPGGTHRGGFVAQGSDARWFAAVPIQDAAWAAMCEEFSRSDLLAQYPTLSARLEAGDHLHKVLVSYFESAGTRDEIVERLRRVGVPAAPVNTPSEALADPRVAESRALSHVQRPGLGAVQEARFVFGQGTPRGDRCGAPALGADTEAVLREAEDHFRAQHCGGRSKT